MIWWTTLTLQQVGCNCIFKFLEKTTWLKKQNINNLSIFSGLIAVEKLILKKKFGIRGHFRMMDLLGDPKNILCKWLHHLTKFLLSIFEVIIEVSTYEYVAIYPEKTVIPFLLGNNTIYLFLHKHIHIIYLAKSALEYQWL